MRTKPRVWLLLGVLGFYASEGVRPQDQSNPSVFFWLSGTCSCSCGCLIPGSHIEVPFMATANRNIEGVTLSVRFDAAILEFVGVSAWWARFVH